jgi:hypothetical protein
MHGISQTSNLSEEFMYKVSQASFIKIPPFQKKISCGKHSDNQSDCISLIQYAQNLSSIKLERGTYVPSSTSKFHQNPIIPSEDIMWKTFSLSDCSTLIKYAWNLSNIELEQGTYVPSITSKFHQNPTIPSQDIVRKAKRTDRQTDRQTR